MQVGSFEYTPAATTNMQKQAGNGGAPISLEDVALSRRAPPGAFKTKIEQPFYNRPQSASATVTSTTLPTGASMSMSSAAAAGVGKMQGGFNAADFLARQR